MSSSGSIPWQQILLSLGQGFSSSTNPALGLSAGVQNFAQQQQYQNALKGMFGQGPQPQTPAPPQIPQQSIPLPMGGNASITPPPGIGGPAGQIMGAGAVPPGVAPPMPGTPSANGAPMSEGGMSPQMMAMLAKLPSAQGFPLMMQMALHQQERLENRQDSALTPMTDAEKQAAGFHPDAVVYKDISGNPVVKQASELKSPAAIQQELDYQAAQAKQAANLPLSAQEQATLKQGSQRIGLEAASQAETARHNKAEESISLNPLGMGVGNAGAVGPNGQPLSGADYLKTLPAAVAGTVKAIGDGRMAPISGFALAKPQGMAIMDAVTHYNPDYDASTIPMRTAARKSFAEGKNGNTVRSLNVAVQHLDTLSGLSDALGNGNLPLVNSLSQTVAQQTGSAAPTNFDAAKHIVGDEITKAIIGTGGSVADREKAQDAISRANSPAQLKGAIQTYQALLGGQLKGLGRQYEQSTKLKDFNDWLAPETQRVLGGLSGGSASPTPGAPSSGPVTVTSDADYAKLPSGTVFVGPDGHQRRKP